MRKLLFILSVFLTFSLSVSGQSYESISVIIDEWCHDCDGYGWCTTCDKNGKVKVEKIEGKTCKLCRGTGYANKGWRSGPKCNYCYGVGKISPRKVTHYELCPYCSGRKICNKCGGKLIRSYSVNKRDAKRRIAEFNQTKLDYTRRIDRVNMNIYFRNKELGINSPEVVPSGHYYGMAHRFYDAKTPVGGTYRGWVKTKHKTGHICFTKGQVQVRLFIEGIHRIVAIAKVGDPFARSGGGYPSANDAWEAVYNYMDNN